MSTRHFSVLLSEFSFFNGKITPRSEPRNPLIFLFSPVIQVVPSGLMRQGVSINFVPEQATYLFQKNRIVTR